MKVVINKVTASVVGLIMLVGLCVPSVMVQSLAPTPTHSTEITMTPTSTKIPSASLGNVGRGSLLFMTLGCQSCHGYGGMNPTGHKRTVIVDPAYLATKTDAELVSIIRKGFNPPYYMKSYRRGVSSQQMSDLLAWLRSHKKR